jgi:predicted metalloprotease
MKAYLDLSFFDQLETRFGARGDFARAYVIAHEIGHHIQNLLGTLDRVHRKQSGMRESEANALSVRLELQADFYAGVWAHHAREMAGLDQSDIQEAMEAASAIGDDTLQKQTQGYVVPDAFTHGTSEQRMRWFMKGFRSGDPSEGDTFSARSL